MLPGAYDRWFREMLGSAPPVETRATCDACVMLPGAADLPPDGPFDPTVRCCTYHPHLVSHLVGGILERGTEAGKALVRARIAARHAVTPLGIAPAPAYAALHGRLSQIPGAFGREPAIRCPFLDGERCSIWEHRGMACAAFHCKYDRGTFGLWRWNVLMVSFNGVDRALSRWLLAKHGLDAATCDALLHKPDDAELYDRAWGAWKGREEEYFVGAAREIEPLSWTEVEAIGGAELAELAAGLRAALPRMDDRPEQARKGTEVLYHIRPGGGARVQNASIPLDLIELTEDVVQRVAELEEPTPLDEIGLPEELIRRLLDWQVIR